MNQQVDLIKLYHKASRSKFYLPLPSEMCAYIMESSLK